MTNQPLSYRGLGIGGLVDLPHAAFADEGGDVVVAESGADLERHDLRMETWGPFYAQAIALATWPAQNCR